MNRLVAALIVVAGIAAAQPAAPARPGEPLPPWTPGTLDIHQITTGRGNAALSIFPDGTTLLVDAGASDAAGADPRPNGSRTPGAWIVQYIRRALGGRDAGLDYAVLTHFHPDHMGQVTGNEPRSPDGLYVLSGITEVGDAIPIATLIDRGDEYLPPPDDRMMSNYRAFVQAQIRRGTLRRVRAEAGRADQIVLAHERARDATFEARIVGVNDRVWTGEGTATKTRFPDVKTIAAAEDRPTENMCSVEIRLKYGAFDYFTGGDMPGYPVPGGPAWHDLESDVARAIGPTDVHVVNHHGSIEEENPFFLATLRSRVLIVPAWSPTHPSPDVLKRILSTRVYPSPRDIFITLFREPTKLTTGPRASQIASDHGHVVVRVEPGGARYWVFVLDDTTEAALIRSVHGPYDAVR